MAQVLKILTVPKDEPLLRRKSLRVTDFGDTFQQFVDNLVETLRSTKGFGLAAIQVGVPLRVFAATIHGAEPTVFVNPIIISATGCVTMDEECLSVPDKMGRVARAENIVVDALDRFGQPVHYELETLPSRIFQHEIEHLDGGLYIDRLEGKLRDISLDEE